MHLRAVIEKYKGLAGGFGRPAPLAAFGLSREEAERLFSIFDEDYHISRFFHFSDQRPAAREPSASGAPPALAAYSINGFEHTHVSLDAEIESIL